MNIENAVRNRRSIRVYQAVVPEQKDIRKIIRAGTWAPSGLNNQPWRFKIIRAVGEKEKLSRFTKYAQIIRKAPVCICVFLDKDAVYNRDKDILAVGACIQNILLQAFSLGLGTCWLGEILNRKDEVRKAFKLPAKYELMAVITLGKPAGKKGKGSRCKLESFLLA